MASGRYNNASEVIRTVLRLLQSEEQKMENLRNALDAVPKDIEYEEVESFLKDHEEVESIHELPLQVRKTWYFSCQFRDPI